MSKFIIFISMIIMLFSIVGCTNYNADIGDDMVEARPDELEIIEIGPNDVVTEHSWAVWFRSLEELLGYFDLAIIGTVDEIVEVWDRSHENSTSGIPDPITDHRIVVEEILFNPTERDIGESIVVASEGGEWEGVRYISFDIPPFATGERVILFLRSGGTRPDVVGYHPQGRFTIYNDKVYNARYRLPQARAV